MLCGLDQLSGNQYSAQRRRLRDSRVGLLTHSAAIDRHGRSALAVLEELGVAPKLIFAPEHGFDAVQQAEEPVLSRASTPEFGVNAPVLSLYGTRKEDLSPREEHLAEIDVLVIDLCDVGSRYYTYVWTALLSARAARSSGVHTLVLDRPNPISGDPSSVEGAPQSPDFLSFVGLEPLPIRHALTLGEILAWFFVQDGHEVGPDTSLSVIPTRGWERLRTAEAWGRPFVGPSPNMPTLETALVYPGACLIEGTNLSEGRGTTTPFQTVGAPFLNGPELARELEATGVLGAWIRPVSFRPTFEKHAGHVCHGVTLHVTNPQLFRPVATYLSLIAIARRMAGEHFAFRHSPYEFESDRPAFDLLTGSDRARLAIQDGVSPEELVSMICPVDPAYRDLVLQAEARILG
ncbi:MAG TPA: DUF1343 domain-containing protein [Polyangiaceae bacterium]|nr:DUF1343 domain-containing protein [Polyangiaceae bacterium]